MADDAFCKCPLCRISVDVTDAYDPESANQATAERIDPLTDEPPLWGGAEPATFKGAAQLQIFSYFPPEMQQIIHQGLPEFRRLSSA